MRQRVARVTLYVGACSEWVAGVNEDGEADVELWDGDHIAARLVVERESADKARSVLLALLSQLEALAPSGLEIVRPESEAA